MQISIFNEFISHEMFLLKYFNNKKLDEKTGFYNKYAFGVNLLEYKIEKSFLNAISLCKEYKLKLNKNKDKELEL